MAIVNLFFVAERLVFFAYMPLTSGGGGVCDKRRRANVYHIRDGGGRWVGGEQRMRVVAERLKLEAAEIGHTRRRERHKRHRGRLKRRHQFAGRRRRCSGGRSGRSGSRRRHGCRHIGRQSGRVLRRWRRRRQRRRVENAIFQLYAAARRCDERRRVCMFEFVRRSCFLNFLFEFLLLTIFGTTIFEPKQQQKKF